MKSVVAFTVPVATGLVTAGSLWGCSNTSTTSVSLGGNPDASEDGGALEAAAESGPDASLNSTLGSTRDAAPLSYEAGPPSPLVGIRIANFSASAPPVDFCFAPHGTTAWQGPMLAAPGPQLAGGGDGGTPGLLSIVGGTTALGFPGVTRYFLLAPGQYDVALVAGGSPTCVPLEEATLPALAADGLVTVALFANLAADAGDAIPKIQTFIDDPGVPAASVIGAGRLGLRFINAAPSVPEAGLGYVSFSQSPGLPILIFKGVPYGEASSPSFCPIASWPYIDDAGYYFAPVTDFPYDPGASGGESMLSVMQNGSSVTLAAGPALSLVGALLTEVLIVTPPASSASDAGGAPSDGGAFQLLQCVDNGGTLGVGAPCSVISE